MLTATGNKLRCSTDAEPAPGETPNGELGSNLVDPFGAEIKDQLKTLHEAVVKELHKHLDNQ